MLNQQVHAQVLLRLVIIRGVIQVQRPSLNYTHPREERDTANRVTIMVGSVVAKR